MQVSQLVPYSIGMATENKPLDTNDLNVMPTEVFSATDGEITLNPEEVISKGQDREGRQYQTSVVSDNSITAQWLPFGSNRRTAPDVSRGEKVLLYRYADTDTYYWKELGLDEELRRLETVIMVFNGDPKRGSKGKPDFNNCYYLEVSTHNKTVTFGTSKLNGEIVTQHMQFNPGTGEFVWEDDTGNTIFVSSTESLIQLVNNVGSEYSLRKQDALVKVDGNIDAQAGGDINLEAGGNINMTAGGEIALQSGGATSLQASDVAITSPEVSMSGNLAVAGNIVAGGTLGGVTISLSAMGSSIPGYS